jgi:hypothetical protein
MSAHEMKLKVDKRPREPRFWGYMAEYETAEGVLHAAEAVRDAGYAKWDCLTPYPVHGLDKAMGVKRTILPWLVLGGGLTGLAIAIFMQWYVNSPLTESSTMYILSGYPLNISGKPNWSIPANVPIMFELAVLLSALTAFFGVWALSRLPRFYHPAFNVARFRRVTDDRFFLIVEAADGRFDRKRSLTLLVGTHPAAIEEVMD